MGQTWLVDGVEHKLNPNGGYALYRKGETWRESAKVTNESLLKGGNDE